MNTPRRGGQSTQAGIQAQNWAALSLFVQESFNPSFIEIELEKPGLSDFILKFTSKRIICESKRKRVSYREVREIFDSIKAIGENDEILIICTSADEKMLDRFENGRYYLPIYEDLKKKQFTDRHIALLPRLNFWIVDQSINVEIVRNLLEQRFSVWLPNNELVNDLLVEKIFKGSAIGGTYAKAEFVADVESYIQKISTDDNANFADQPIEAQVKEILGDIINPTSRLNSSNNPLKTLVSKPHLHHVALQELTSITPLDLERWDLLWQATFSSYYSREVFNIFRESIVDSSKAAYALKFIESKASSIRYQFRDEFQYKEATRVIERIHEVTRAFDQQIIELMIKFYKYAKQNVFYIKKRHGSTNWILEEIAKSINKIALETKSQRVQQVVVKFISTDFNLVEDDSRHWHSTPPEFFEILRHYINAGLIKLDTFTKQITEQYELYYQRFLRKPAFQGWDHFGAGISSFGGHSIEDKSFLTLVIIPLLSQLPNDERWTFVLDNVARTEKSVSKGKPDFLNRACIPSLIMEYTSGKNQNEALGILTDFIKMRRGIPRKIDLIYQAVRSSDMTTEKKWELLQIGIAEYGYPVNVFMDQILQQLLSAGHVKAFELFRSIITDDGYIGRQTHLEFSVPGLISSVLSDKKTFSDGVRLLREYIQTPFFNEKLGTFQAYDLKRAVLEVFEKDVQSGVEVLKDFIKDSPTINRQAVFGAVLRDTPDNLVERLYYSAVKPTLDKSKKAEVLAQMFSDPNCRENVVWFGEKLAKQKKFKEALEVAEFFINDPDPIINNDYDKQIVQGENNSTINTVRGVLPWVLIPFCTVEGREYMPKIFELTKRLCSDKTLYVREQGCLVLESLINIRHSRMPSSKEWFIDSALADQIEGFAFNMLADKKNHHRAIMKRLAHIFTKIRTLDEGQALKVVKLFDKYDDHEVLDGLLSFIIFMAEFRQTAFPDWPKERGDLSSYDPAHLKEELESLARTGNHDIRRGLAWHFGKLPEENNKNKEFARLFSISTYYLGIMIENYDHSVFESVYYFIEKYIDREFDVCYRLWRKCLSIEQPALQKKSEEKAEDFTWWPYFYNDVVLIKVAKRLGDKVFMDDLKLLLSHPPEVIIANDLDKIVNYLGTIKQPRATIDELFKKIIARRAKYYKDYEKWLATDK